MTYYDICMGNMVYAVSKHKKLVDIEQSNDLALIKDRNSRIYTMCHMYDVEIIPRKILNTFFMPILYVIKGMKMRNNILFHLSFRIVNDDYFSLGPLWRLVDWLLSGLWHWLGLFKHHTYWNWMPRGLKSKSFLCLDLSHKSASQCYE